MLTFHLPLHLCHNKVIVFIIIQANSYIAAIVYEFKTIQQLIQIFEFTSFKIIVYPCICINIFQKPSVHINRVVPLCNPNFFTSITFHALSVVTRHGCPENTFGFNTLIIFLSDLINSIAESPRFTAIISLLSLSINTVLTVAAYSYLSSFSVMLFFVQ